MRAFTIRSITCAFAAACAFVAAPLDAQYFGKNKVQYRTFDFQVLRTPSFDVYYYPEEEAAAKDAARMAERWYERLSELLDYRFDERQPLILYASHPDFQQTNVTPSAIGEGTGGFTEAFKQRVVLPLTGSYSSTDHVVGHELVHAFQYDISGLGRAGPGIEAAARRFQVPLWFIEGMAEYLSLGPVDPVTAMWLRDAALEGELPTVEEMTRDPSFFPYRWGHAFWAYVGGRWGDAVIGQLLKQVGQGVPYEAAFLRILNASLEEISEEWHTAIRRAYLPMFAERMETRELAFPLIVNEEGGGRLNVGPVLSPDGSKLAFLSSLSDLDVELYVADARTGEVLQRLRKGTRLDPHFQSIRFINSAGAWSPDSRRFVFSALQGEGDVLVILDAVSGRVTRQLRVPGVRSISNPAWSPDGRTIAFSGIRGGLSDLYLLDLESGESRQLTDDPYAQLHPAFSPDGGTLAFVTDRGMGTDLQLLVYGGYGIAVLDLDSGATRLLPSMPEGSRNISPSWSADGRSLYFISDRGGVPNIFRLEVTDGSLFRVTDLFTGAAGITELSPALSVARDGSRLVFSSYEENGYNLYALTDSEELAGEPVTPELLAGGEAAATLPPLPRPEEPAFNRVAAALDDSSSGLPSRAAVEQYQEEPYGPRLSLDYLGQPSLGISIGGPFGGGVVGGGSAVFSDLLGRHNLFVAVQGQGLIDEIGFAVAYLNRKKRWNFGGVAQRIPYISGFFQQGIDGDEFIQRIVRLRLFDSSLQGIAQYPFSRVMRAEFSAGARRIATDAKVLDFVYDASTGVFLEERESEQEGVSFNFAQASAALVYDNALMGYTSPLAGQRFRFELTPMYGELQLLSGLADYRRYFFLRPLTLALRGYHLGRYGRDAEGVFRPFFLGFPFWLRGYSFDSLAEDCRATQLDESAAECEVINQAFGDRIGVANAELRFPLLGRIGESIPLGLPPVEGFLFADAGVAWGDDTSPVFAPGVQEDPLERGILRSVGVGARVNVFGYFVVELDYVNPLDRARGWHWQFAIQPGF
ncbi:MAG: BamA/TamA family outer membrane protein [Longimicrobiaceae bacterium]